MAEIITGTQRDDANLVNDGGKAAGAASATSSSARQRRIAKGLLDDDVANQACVAHAGGGDDRVHGSAKGDAVDGGGDDLIRGGKRDDLLVGGAGKDVVHGGNGKDRIWGDNQGDNASGADDVLFGNNGKDAIHGGGGDDTITGGHGADQIWGGAGNDLFRYEKVSDSTAKVYDTIWDFDGLNGGTADRDRLDFSGIEAALGIDFTWLGRSEGGSIGSNGAWYSWVGDETPDTADDFTFVHGDVDQDGDADLVVRLKGLHGVAAADIDGVNKAPEITSGGGGTTASISIAEDTTAVADVDAADPDPETTLTYALAGGADQALFAIDENTGVLSFVAAPDFEAPADSNGDNEYEVQVQVSDGRLTDVQTLTVTVKDVNEAPTLTADAAEVSVAEDAAAGTAVADVDGSDPDTRADLDADAGNDAFNDLTYSIVSVDGFTSGAVYDLFSIDGASGQISLAGALDYDTDQGYALVVRVTDGGSLHDETTINVNVTPASNSAPTSTSGSIAIDEDTAVTLTLADFGAYADADGDAMAAVKITALPGNGALLWDQDGDGTYQAVPLDQLIGVALINAGRLRFVPGPNENGASYATIGFQVSDGTALSDASYDLTVNVAAVDDGGVVIGPANLQYDPTIYDTTPFNRFMVADADATGSVTVTITRTAGDGTFSVAGAPAGGTAIVSGGGAVVTLTGTAAAINAYVAGNNITLDTQGFDADTFTISLAGGGSIANFVVNDVPFSTTSSANTNNWAGFNVFETSLGSGDGNDTVYTSWSHLGDGATAYLGSTGSDTIFLNFTAGQLQDVLSLAATRDDLQGFLSAPTGDTLSLGATSWRASAAGFEFANIELAKEWSTRAPGAPASNYVDINTNWKDVLTLAETLDADGAGGNDFIVATAASARLGFGGNDVLVASDQGNTLDGGDGLDLLLGGDGADTLVGGLGADVLAGGAGADAFTWGAEAPGAANADMIADYDFTEGDTLDLSALLDSGYSLGEAVGQFVSVTQLGTDILVFADPSGMGSFGAGPAYTLIGVGTASTNDPVAITFGGQDRIFTV